MSELRTSHNEQGSERIPSEEEVRWLFRGSTGEVPFTEVPKREDEQGLCFWEIKVEDGEGQREYTYERKKQQGTEQGIEITATIYTTYYDKDGMPAYGESIAKLVNGNWRVTPVGPFELTKKFV
ncbi:MAG: hypothetical protein WC817_00045 [Patescibacteria group bacterium]|jgi:hypothetical protein